MARPVRDAPVKVGVECRVHVGDETCGLVEQVAVAGAGKGEAADLAQVDHVPRQPTDEEEADEREHDHCDAFPVRSLSEKG